MALPLVSPLPGVGAIGSDDAEVPKRVRTLPALSRAMPTTPPESASVLFCSLKKTPVMMTRPELWLAPLPRIHPLACTLAPIAPLVVGLCWAPDAVYICETVEPVVRGVG